MKTKIQINLLVGSLLVSVASALMPFWAFATASRLIVINAKQVNDASTTSPEDLSQLNTQAQMLTTYIISGEFSIQYPAGWFHKESNEPGQLARTRLTIFNQVAAADSLDFPPYLVKTDVVIFKGSFTQISGQLKPGVHEGKVIQEQKLTIKGRDAYQVITELENGLASITTVINYKDQETVLISSLYSQKQNQKAILVIKKIHASFQKELSID